MIYNSQYSTTPIHIVQGDDIDLAINIQKYNTITLVWEDYDLTGKFLRMVVENKHGTIIVDWATITGELSNAGSLLYISADAIEEISCCGSFDGHLVEVTPQVTLWKGIVKIEGGLI
jgi:hypothetical protein